MTDRRYLASAIAVAVALALIIAQPTIAADATEIYESTGIRSGVALVISDRPDLARQLADSGRMIVHLALTEAEQVAAVRDQLAASGLGGRILTTALNPDGQLPHPNRFVNLVVADLDALQPQLAGDNILPQEIDRVLAVRGATYLRQNGKWTAAQKAAEAGIDGWFSRWYDATGNCVSHDQAAGFPVAVQWQHGPAMEDGTADGKIMRVADGRIVYLGARTGELFCRDAGNGTLLWSRNVGLDQRDDIVIKSGRVYLWHNAAVDEDPQKLGERGHLAAFDLATGELVQTYDQGLTAGTAQPIEWTDNHDGGSPRIRRDTPVPWFTVNDELVIEAYAGDLVILNRETGARRWQQRCQGELTWFSPVVGGGLVVAYEVAAPARRGRHDESQYAPAITAFDVQDGKQKWRIEGFHQQYEIPDKTGTYLGRAGVKPLSISGDRLLVQTASYQFRQGGSVAVFDRVTGHERWRHRFEPKERYTQGSYRAVLRGDEVVLMCGLGIVRFRADDGAVIEEIEPTSPRRQARANSACAASRATEDLLIANAYLYHDGESARTNFGARGQCGQGVVPAHGLIFVPPTACDCGDYTRGYQALTPVLPGQAIADEARLVTGKPAKDADDVVPAEWSHFLGGPTRRSAAAEGLPAALRQCWQVDLGGEKNDQVTADRRQSERWLGQLSAPTASAGIAAMSLPEGHEVAAVNFADGKIRWRAATIGKVDSPPTLCGGLAVYGCDAGYVTARSIADGSLAWQFRATPTDGLAMQHGHLASTHPIPGSVLVIGDRVIAVAGHHTDLAALHVWVLDLATGKPLAHRALDAARPQVTANGIAVADEDGNGFWLGSGISPFHLSIDLQDLPSGRDAPGPPISFDRTGDRLRFRTPDGRGGSTHGWKQAMQTVIGGARAHRIALDGGIAYATQDPTSRDRHPANAANSKTLVALAGTWREKKDVWSVTQASLGNPDSVSALIKVGDRLYLGGGQRDGSAGFVQALDAASGTPLARYALPSRVTECGLAAADGRLIVCCENGVVVALGE